MFNIAINFVFISLLNNTHTDAKQLFKMMVSNKTDIHMDNPDEDDLMNNMYNALFQCFGIIITG